MFISPKKILVDFLRVNLSDPRSRAESTTTDEFDGGSTDFTLTASSGRVTCVTAVTVDGTAQTKWKDYRWDEQNQKVIFYSNTASGTDNVDITYKYGTPSWIYPDKPIKSLTSSSFPRINILSPGGTGERLGQYNSDVESVQQFQIDIWAKEDNIFTIDSVKYSGDKLTEYLAYEITKYFRSSEDDLFPALYNYTLIGTPRDMGFDKEMQCHRHIIEVELKGINVGELYN